MKKTLTANISGTVFHIEEDAFEKLHRYLDSIRSQFIGTDGQEEIMADIEGRIAELLQERLDGRREVISIADVEHVVAIMGQPEDYRDPAVDEDIPGAAPPPGSGGPNWTQTGTKRKRLYRDPDDRWIGGVLGGIGAYFSIDPLILRVVYIALLFLGVGWLIYLILWIVVPPATTAAEKLEMRGEPVNVENLKRVFDEGSERVRAGAEQVTREARHMGRKYAPQARRGADEFLSFLGDLFRLVFNVIAKVVGVVLLMGGAILAVVLLMALVGEFTLLGLAGSTTGITNFHDLATLVVGDPRWVTLGWVAILGFVLAPVIGLIYGGLSLLFNITSPKWFGWALTTIWIIAIVVLTSLGMRVTSDLRSQEVVETRHELATPAENVITLTCTEGGHRIGDRGDDFVDRLRVEGSTVMLGWPTVDVKQSPDSLYHLVVKRRARGNSYKAASNRAEAIEASWSQRDGTVDLSAWFSFHRNDLYRGQNVRYVLEVPVGGAVNFEASVGGMLDDVQNVTRTLDSQMVGHTWTMTESGLRSDTAPSSPRRSNNRKERERSWKITINEEKGTEIRTAGSLFTRLDLLGIFMRRV